MKNLILILLCVASFSAFALDEIPEHVKPGKTEYFVRLKNGDKFSGTVKEFVHDKKEGEGIKMLTALGMATIFANQIQEIGPVEEYYRHRHRVWLMPTAEPIGDDHFIGSYELLFLYGGFGISDYVSFTAGRSILPGVASYEQISSMSGKLSLGGLSLGEYANRLSFAVGVNIGFANSGNRLEHYFGIATLELSRTMITGMVFTKSGNDDLYIVNFQENSEYFIYENGAFGIGFGIDTRLPKWKDLHLIAEIWNTNVGKPTDSAVLLGLRLANESVAYDFGLAFFTTPFAVPFASFSWTPF